MKPSDLGYFPFESFRPHQIAAIRAIIEAFEHVDVVILDAPTGAGKTAIAEAVRLLMKVRAFYVPPGKDLQDQFAADYPHAAVLKGKANYPSGTKPHRADVCTSKMGREGRGPCLWCDDVFGCAYWKAKARAMSAELTVWNAYLFLAEANFVRSFEKRPLTILDECDTLEDVLMGAAEVRFSARLLKELDIDPPTKAAHKATVDAWVEDIAIPALAREVIDEPYDPDEIRRQRRLKGLLARCDEVDMELMVRSYEDGDDAVVLKPVLVSDWADGLLWRHGDKWLLMSATVVSHAEMADSLGIRDYEYVSVPSTFPVEHRPIRYVPIASMTRADYQLERLLDGIERVIALHPGEPVLIHAHTYKLTDEIMERIPQSISYSDASLRAKALSQFKAEGGVLVAPSMDRGIDLPGDLCRVQIIAKIPFPYLGDAQVAARLHTPSGAVWYDSKAIRSIIQASGRGVRSEDDFATTYILDRSFGKLLRKRRRIFPSWWREAVETTAPRAFMEGD